MDIKKLKPNKWNFNRMTTEEYESLKTQIKEDYGKDKKVTFATKIEVRPSSNVDYEIIDGEHKVRVCKELGFLEIPDEMIEIKEMSDTELIERLMKLRTRGTEIDAFKQAEAFKEIKEEKGIEELERISGLSRKRLYNIMNRIDNIPQDLREKVSLARLSASAIDEIAFIDDCFIQKEVVEECITKPEITREELREVIDTIKSNMGYVGKGKYVFRLENTIARALREYCKDKGLDFDLTLEKWNNQWLKEWLKKEGYLKD